MPSKSKVLSMHASSHFKGGYTPAERRKRHAAAVKLMKKMGLKVSCRGVG
jgi:hypothetical protein